MMDTPLHRVHDHGDDNLVSTVLWWGYLDLPSPASRNSIALAHESDPSL